MANKTATCPKCKKTATFELVQDLEGKGWQKMKWVKTTTPYLEIDDHLCPACAAEVILRSETVGYGE